MANEVEALQVLIGVALDAFRSEMHAATELLKKNFGEMEASMGKTNSAATLLGTTLKRAFSGLAIAEVMRRSVVETVKFSDESLKLANRLGITTEKASILNIMLGDVYSSTEAYAGALTQLTRQLRTNEDGLRKMGLESRKADGSLKDSDALMQAALNTLRKYREGSDRNLAGLVLFGRGAAEVSALLRIQEDSFAKAEEKARRLGLVLGPEGLKNVEDFKAAQNDLGDSLLAVYQTISGALLPILTDLGNDLAAMGEASLPVLRAALAGVRIAFYGVKEVVDLVWQAFQFLARTITTVLAVAFDVLAGIVTLDMARVRNAMLAGEGQIKDSWDDMLKSMVEKSRANSARIMDALGMGEPKKFEKPGGGPGKKSFRDPEADKREAAEQLRIWQEQFQALREAQGVFHELSKRDEADFWISKLEIASRNAELFKVVGKTAFDAERAAQKERLEEEKAALDLSLEAAKFNKEEQVAITERWRLEMLRFYGMDSKEYKSAAEEKRKATEALVEAQLKIARIGVERERDIRLGSIDAEATILSLRRQVGAISDAEQLTALQALEEQRFAIKRQFLEQELESTRLTEEQIAQIKSEMLVLDAERAAQRSVFTARVRAEETQMWRDLLDIQFSVLQQTIDQFLTTGITLRQFMLNLTKSIADFFIKMGLDIVKRWIINQITMTSATAAGEGTRTGLAAAGAATGAAISTSKATTEITAYAASGAAGAFSSLAGIPIVGVILGAAAAIAVFAAIMAYASKSRGGGTPSAAGGWWEVPGDTLAAIHQREMVLPADVAEPLRDNFTAGGGGFGKMEVHIHATDSKSVERLFENNAEAMLRVLRGRARDFSSMVPRT